MHSLNNYKDNILNNTMKNNLKINLILVNLTYSYLESASNFNNRIAEPNIKRISAPKEIIMTMIAEPKLNELGQYYIFCLQNYQLFENKTAIKAIYNTLMRDETFLNFGKKKVILTTAILNDLDVAFHHNVLIENKTTFKEYYDQVKNIIQPHYEYEDEVTTYPIFIIRV